MTSQNRILLKLASSIISFPPRPRSAHPDFGIAPASHSNGETIVEVCGMVTPHFDRVTNAASDLGSYFRVVKIIFLCEWNSAGPFYLYYYFNRQIVDFKPQNNFEDLGY